MAPTVADRRGAGFPHAHSLARSVDGTASPPDPDGRYRPRQHLHLSTLRPRGASPPRGRSQGHAWLESSAPRVDGQPSGGTEGRGRVRLWTRSTWPSTDQGTPATLPSLHRLLRR